MLKKAACNAAHRREKGLAHAEGEGDRLWLLINFFLAMASLPSYTSNQTRMPQSPQHNVCSSRPMGVGLRITTIRPGMPLSSYRTMDSSNTISHEQTIDAWKAPRSASENRRTGRKGSGGCWMRQRVLRTSAVQSMRASD
eukprot:196442-Pleurochrysis_carterae.AAC.1